MSTPILATKLYIPSPPPKLIIRPRLIERLNEGLHRKLTIISAPAGFGKTTLVSEWVDNLRFTNDDLRFTNNDASTLLSTGLRSDAAKESQIENRKPEIVNRVAWLSLDEGDNDPTRFLAYFVAALQTIAADIGKGVLGALHATQPQMPPIDSILTALLNEITLITDDFVLVLDDYHVIDAKPVDHAISFLLEHQPPQMHLVIASREDPNLPLARLRARGQLTELRAIDLRFTVSEATGFLNQVMRLKLSTEDIATLETRTEGWIAGLQLAALAMLAMQGHQDTASFIQSFTGSHHFVLDYLLEEVLHQQPEHVQAFLLRTSILKRLCGPLCDAVLLDASTSGQETLEALEHGNLFIVALDNERRWYRYHHLFGDLLRQRLGQSLTTEEIAKYHIRASEWHEKNGNESDAFQHAIAAMDFGRAARLAEVGWESMNSNFQSAAWLGWVKQLPEELILVRPVLCTQIAWALMDISQVDASESRLRDAERCLEGPAEKMVVVDEEQFRTLPARIAFARAYNAQAQGNAAATVKYAELTLKLTPEEDHFIRAQTTAILGGAHWTNGELEAASKAMSDWIESSQKAGNFIFAIASASGMADILIARGRLREAVRTYQQSLQLASAHEREARSIIAHHYLGLAMLYHEMGDDESATQHYQKSMELGQQSTLVDWPYRRCLAQARFKEAEGELEAALTLLDEAKRAYVQVPMPDTHPSEALKARIYLKQGRLTQARDWAREHGLSVKDELSYLHEFEHITLARVLIAEYQGNRAGGAIPDAVNFLERLLKDAEEGGRTGSVIEILLLQALVHQTQGDILRALVPLERALRLAEPEGYLRIFVDEGLPMAALLREAAKHDTAPDYVRQLRAAFGKAAPPAEDRTPDTQPLIEPLSERELEVLRLLGTELNGPEIARELLVSLNTMRTHTKNIYNKLGVTSRRAAVRRAEELDLL